MRIGEAAARAGVNIETLRYYERRGLLREPARQASGYRAYDEDSVRVVRFVKRAQELGFSLADVEELLRLAAGNAPASCREVRALATAKIGDLDRRIATLGAMRASLVDLVRTCNRRGRKRECPLIEAIQEQA
jgi:Hg(II)-responsive transcriptional regulator